MKKTHIIFLLALISCSLLSQTIRQDANFRFENISANKGLSHIAVNDILHDRDGYVWIATYDGINRYDGHSFKIFKNISEDRFSLINNRVLTMFESKSGLIYVGTERGICAYNKKHGRFEALGINEIDNNKTRVFKIFEDSFSRLWIVYGNGQISVSDSLRTKINDLCPARKNISTIIHTITEDSYGNTWIVTNRELLCFDKNLKNVSIINNSVGSDYSFTSIIIKDKQMYASSGRGILVLDINFENQIELIVKKKYLDTIPFRTMLFDKEENLWLASPHVDLLKCTFQNNELIDIIRFSPSVTDEYSLPSNFISCLFLDQMGAVWGGTQDNGLFRVSKQQNLARTFSKRNGLSSDYIISICKYDTERILIGKRQNGLDVYNTRTNKLEMLWFDDTPIQHLAVTDMFVDSRACLWIATGGGLFYLLPGETELKHSSQLVSTEGNLREIKSVIEDDHGFIWAGGVKCLYRIKMTKEYDFEDILEFKNDLFNQEQVFANIVNTIYNDPEDNTLWIGFWNKGLARITPFGGEEKISDFKFESFQHSKSNENSLPGNFVSSIFRDSQQGLWISTEGAGFCKMVESSKGAQFITYNEKNGLSNNTTKSIIEGFDGNLYIPTNQRLSILNPYTNIFRYYTQNEGLLSEYFNSAALKMEDGTLVFAGNKGLVLIKNEERSREHVKPKLLFGDLYLINNVVKPGDNTGILEQSLNFTNSLIMKYSQNTFSIDIVAIDWNSERNEIRYRLKGYDDDWQINTNPWHKVDYTKVPFGNYVFEFKSTDSRGQLVEEIREMKIKIKAPLFLRTYMLIIYVVLLIVIIVGINSYFIRIHKLQLNLRSEQLEKEQTKEITEAKLKFFTNITHEFKTPMSLMVGPIDELLGNFTKNDHIRHRLLLVKRQINYSVRLLEELLDFRKIQKGEFKLHCQELNMVAFLEQMASAFSPLTQNNGVQTKIESQKEIILLWFDVRGMEKVMYNILSNAFKYTPKGGLITINIKEIGDSACITIENTGDGLNEAEIGALFDRFFQGKQAQKHYGTGIGLNFSKTLIELHKGTISAYNSDDNNAVFKITLPLGNEHLNEESIRESDKDALNSYFETNLIIAENETVELEEEPASIEQDLPLMMILEDNKEMRSFIKDVFKKEFRIMAFENGKAAFDIIHSKVPDIIVSDIVMPEMNGIEFCRKVKSDQQLSHIPIIILSSQDVAEDMVEGFEIGAESYIPKPFNTKILKAQVNSLLINRTKLKSRYHNAFIEENYIDKSNQKDKEFLHSAVLVIEEHISDVNFSNKDICDALFISKTKLYSELKRISGKTPVDLIKEYRMQRAGDLMKDKTLNISEVYDQCGYSSRAYFYKCFKEKYGMTPNAFRNELKEDQNKTG